jgi:hypothetical protein
MITRKRRNMRKEAVEIGQRRSLETTRQFGFNARFAKNLVSLRQKVIRLTGANLAELEKVEREGLTFWKEQLQKNGLAPTEKLLRSEQSNAPDYARQLSAQLLKGAGPQIDRVAVQKACEAYVQARFVTVWAQAKAVAKV